MNINQNKVNSTMQRGVHYLPTVKMSDNKRIGYSFDYTGAVSAKGTLYPNNMNNASGIGSIQSFINGEHTTTGYYPVDLGVFTNNEVKYKTAEYYFSKYKKLKNISVNFRLSTLSNVTPSAFSNTARIIKKQIFQLTTTTFVMVFTQTGGTAGMYAVVGTIAASGAVTYGTPVLITTVQPSDDNYSGLCEISTGKYVYTHHQTATTIRNTVFTASGTTITMGTGVDITITSITLGQAYIRSEKVDTDKYITTYCFASGASAYAYVTTVSGTVPTNGAITTFSTTTYYGIGALMSSPTNGIFFLNAGSTQLYLAAFTLSGTTLTVGTQSAASATSQYSHTILGPCMKLATDFFFISSMSNYTGYGWYITTSGTTWTLTETISGFINQSGYGGNSTSQYSNVLLVAANKWIQSHYVSNGAANDWLHEYTYDATSQRLAISMKQHIFNSNTTAPLNDAGYSVRSFGVVGAYYIFMGTSTSAGLTMGLSVFEQGSCELYFEGEVTPFATISNTANGFNYAPVVVNKAINKKVAYLSMKNVSGHTVTIQTNDWLFDVE